MDELSGDPAPDDQAIRFAGVLEAARSGEADAFEDLHSRVAGPVHGFLRARGAEDPEGLANEVLLRAFRSIGDFEGGETQFRAWVFTIARNALVDQRRRWSRRPRLQVVDPDDLPEAVVPQTEPVSFEDERIQELLAELTDDQREVVLLRVVAGLPVKEVAEMLGRSDGAVKLLQHRAIQSLRKKLAPPP